MSAGVEPEPAGPSEPAVQPGPVPVPVPVQSGGPERPSVRRRLTFLALGCVLAGLLAVGLFGPWGSSAPALKLPASLPSLSGGPAVRLPALGADLPEPVVITFFASWCQPCESEVPAVARYAKAEAAKGVKVDFIGIDENDTSAGRGFVKRSGVGFPVGSDPQGTVLEDLDAEAALPQTIFISAGGQIIHHVYGSVSAGSILQTWIVHLLSS